MNNDERPAEDHALVFLAGDGMRLSGGGYAAVIVHPPKDNLILSGGCMSSSQDREELKALVAVLEALPSNVAMTINLWMTKMVAPISRKYLKGWQERDWSTIRGRPIKDADLWAKALDLGVLDRKITWGMTAEQHAVLPRDERPSLIAGRAGRAAYDAYNKAEDARREAALRAGEPFVSGSQLRYEAALERYMSGFQS